MGKTVMAKEIEEQINVLERIESKNQKVLVEIAGEVEAKKITHATFAGRGTSDNACKYGIYLFGTFCNMVAGDATASTITLYDGKPNFNNDLVIGISQSGKAADMIEVLKQANETGAVTVAITNDENSPMAGVAKYHLFCNAEEEVSVAATKTFSAQLALVALLAGYISQNEELLASMREVPKFLKQTLDNSKEKIEKCGQKLKDVNEAFMLARGYLYPIALETALKIQETCYIKSKGFAISDFYHGPLAQIDEKTPVILFAGKGKAFKDSCEMIERLHSTGNLPTIVTNDLELSQKYEEAVLIPDTGCEATSVFPFAMFIQSLAEYTSISRGLNPDSPRALKKVTITK
jgi:glucosamine--fructose-6-phosphate aminotransferase (isomerizing)